MKSMVTVALSLVLTTAAAAPAFAGDHEHAAFPMKADAFKQHVEQRLAKKKAHVEKRITDQKLDATKAKEARDRFDERAAKVRAATATATQDGVVTKEEAHAVREAAGRHHRHHGDKKA